METRSWRASFVRDISIIVLLLLFVLVSPYFPSLSVDTSEPEHLIKFSSMDELREYLNYSKEIMDYDKVLVTTGQIDALSTSSGEVRSQSATLGQAKPDFSSTNIQVEGVDEADMIKSDGKYIYHVVGRSVLIIDSYPAENARIVSAINLTDFIPNNIFINGDRLVIFGARNDTRNNTEHPIPSTCIDIYDVSDRSSPLMINRQVIGGNYLTSRMVGDYVYLVSNYPLYSFENPEIPEEVYRCQQFQFTDCFNLWYFDVPDDKYQFTIMSALDIKNPLAAESKVFMMGNSQNIYVSQKNLYVTYSKRRTRYDSLMDIADSACSASPVNLKMGIDDVRNSRTIKISDKALILESMIKNYSSSLAEEEKNDFELRMQKFLNETIRSYEKTIINKFSISGNSIDYQMQGYVPGNALNQFSMDEYGSNFRIATTTSISGSRNHLYILDENLHIVGRLENLAPGEKIYSVRFMGERAYVVTYRQIDPLFVIDVSDATDPKVLGFLKILGVSDYLHPYDESHLIGVGLDSTADGKAGGIKVALFDVSNVSDPKEMSKYIIGERGSNSNVSRDHKVFLFSKEKNLLVIQAYVLTGKTYGKNWDSWDGAYVFDIGTEEGITLRGNITHYSPGGKEEKYSFYGYDLYVNYATQIKRLLYIGDVLYTVSNSMIKANSIGDLSEISDVDTTKFIIHG